MCFFFSAPVSHRQRHCESPNKLQTRPPRHPRVPRACNDSRVTMHAIWCPPHPIIAMSSSSKKALLESFPSSRICRFPFSSIASTKAPSPSTFRCASEAHRVLSRIPLPAYSSEPSLPCIYHTRSTRPSTNRCCRHTHQDHRLRSPRAPPAWRDETTSEGFDHQSPVRESMREPFSWVRFDQRGIDVREWALRTSSRRVMIGAAFCRKTAGRKLEPQWLCRSLLLSFLFRVVVLLSVLCCVWAVVMF